MLPPSRHPPSPYACFLYYIPYHASIISWRKDRCLAALRALLAEMVGSPEPFEVTPQAHAGNATPRTLAFMIGRVIWLIGKEGWVLNCLMPGRRVCVSTVLGRNVAAVPGPSTLKTARSFLGDVPWDGASVASRFRAQAVVEGGLELRRWGMWERSSSRRSHLELRICGLGYCTTYRHRSSSENDSHHWMAV